MWVTFKPEDGDEQRWEFLADQVMDVAAEAVEKAFGDTWDSFLMAVLKGGMRARRVLLWHLIKTQHPSLKFADLPPFRVGELTVDWDRDEVQIMRDGVADEKKSHHIDESTRDAMLEWLDAELEKAPERSTAGKARSKPKGSNTASPSRST